jgi:hypothetical protein
MTGETGVAGGDAAFHRSDDGFAIHTPVQAASACLKTAIMA